MKKGNTLLFLALFVLAFSSCHKQEEKSRLTGLWLLCQSEDEPVSPYHSMVLEFFPDGESTVAQVSENDPGFSSKWIEYHKTGSWRLKGQRLTLKGRFNHTNLLTAKARLNRLEDDTLVYTVKKYKTSQIDQMTWRKPFQRKFIRVSRSDSLFIGSWEVVSSIVPQLGYRFVFKDDHTYEFYQQLDGNWHNLKDYQGSWYAYGNLVCINHHFDLFDSDRFYEPTVQCYYFHWEPGDEATIHLLPDDNDQLGDFRLKRSETPESGLDTPNK